MTDQFVVDVYLARTGGQLVIKNLRIDFHNDTLRFINSKGEVDSHSFHCSTIVYKKLSRTTGKCLSFGLFQTDLHSFSMVKFHFNQTAETYIPYVVAKFNEFIENNKSQMKNSKTKACVSLPPSAPIRISTPALTPSSSSTQTSLSPNTFQLKKLYNPKKLEADLKKDKENERSLKYTQNMVSSSQPFSKTSSTPSTSKSLNSPLFSIKNSAPSSSSITKKPQIPPKLEIVSRKVEETEDVLQTVIFASTTPKAGTSTKSQKENGSKFDEPFRKVVSTPRTLFPLKLLEPVVELEPVVDPFEFRKLHNPLHACYFNATMQALSACPPLISRCSRLYRITRNREYILKAYSDSSKRKRQILMDFLEMMCKLGGIQMKDRYRLSSEKLRRIRGAIGEYNHQFDNDHQQDAHEFLITVLGAIDDLMVDKAKSDGVRWESEERNFGKSIFCMNPTDSFRLILETKYICRECGKQEFRKNPHNDLSINIRVGESVEDLLEDFMRWSTLEKSCSDCEATTSWKATERISLFPQILTVNLKRYERCEEQANGYSKKECLIRTSFSLNLTKLGGFRRECSEVYLKYDDSGSFCFKGGAADLSDSESLIVDDVKAPELSFNVISDELDILEILKEMDISVPERDMANHMKTLKSIVPAEMKQTDSPQKTRSIKGDGNCFYRSISWALTGSEKHFGNFRRKTVEFLKENVEFVKKYAHGSDPEEYIENMAKDKVWATTCEIFAMANILNLKIFTFLHDGGWTSHSPRTKPREGGIYLKNETYHYEPVMSLKIQNKTMKRKAEEELEESDDFLEMSPQSMEIDDAVEEATKTTPKQLKSKKRDENLEKTKKTDDEKENSEDEKEKVVYSLVSAICHSGPSPGSGHYVTYIKNDKKWTYCSDEKIHKVERSEVASTVSREGYILFYNRM